MFDGTKIRALIINAITMNGANCGGMKEGEEEKKEGASCGSGGSCSGQ